MGNGPRAIPSGANPLRRVCQNQPAPRLPKVSRVRSAWNTSMCVPSPDQHRSTAHTFGDGRGWTLSCRHLRRSRKRQAAQEVRSGLRLAACREESASVGLQKANPVLNISGVPQITVNRELGAQKRLNRVQQPIPQQRRPSRRSGGGDRVPAATCGRSSVQARGMRSNRSEQRS